MRRSALLLVVPALLHHRFHGSSIDYSALAAGAALSFAGLPGPGEPLLVAAGILAARHRLDIAEVILVAFLAATSGGVAGWLVGRAGGRTILSRPGPLLALRERTLKRGDDLFERHPALAVVLVPSFIAGIYRLRARTYLALNALAALVWAAGIGLGSYYAGPVVLDWIADLGTITGIAVVLLFVAAVVGGRRRRRTRRRGV